MVEIAEEKCIACGKCVEDCVGHNLLIQENKTRVLGKCILCGHCVAICPEAAVSIPEYDMEDVQEYQAETFHLDSEQFLNAVKFRRSIRKFKKEEIEKEKLERIIQAGRYTATASNRQGLRFAVVQEQMDQFRPLVWKGWVQNIELLRKQGKEKRADAFLKHYERYQENQENDRLFLGAPALIVVAADHPLDGGLASANIENMAVAEGLGVLYDDYIVYALSQGEEARNWLGLEEKQPVCCMLLGYTDLRYKRTAPRRKADVIWK